MDNLVEEEQPPEWMWPYEKALEEWFDDIERARKEKYGDSDDSGMLKNELAAERRD